MWLLSPGAPRFLFTDFEARPLAGWPPGFYSLAPGFLLHAVVLSELPLTRETLPLRLLGNARLRKIALRELQDIPPGDADHEFLHQMVATLHLLLARDTNILEEDRSILMSELTIEFNRIQQESYRRGEEKGLERGLENGLRQAIADLCEVLEIPLDAERQSHLASLDGDGLVALSSHIKQHRAWPQG